MNKYHCNKHLPSPLRAVVAFPTWAGAKAAAEPARRVAITSFMIVEG